MTSKTLCVVFLCGFFLASIALAQNGRFDLGLTGGVAFSTQPQNNGVTLTPTNNANVVATLWMKFKPKSAIEVNYGRMKNSQHYISTLDYRIPSTVTEFSGAYVFRFAPRGKFSPFMFGGAGVIVFNPDDTLVDNVETGIGVQRQNRFAFLYGGGVDYHVIWRLGVRLQYRGLLFSAPDYKLQTLFTGQHEHMAEPGVGIVFNF